MFGKIVISSKVNDILEGVSEKVILMRICCTLELSKTPVEIILIMNWTVIL